MHKLLLKHQTIKHPIVNSKLLDIYNVIHYILIFTYQVKRTRYSSLRKYKNFSKFIT